MHELSIAASIVELAEEYAAKESAKSITKIEIEIGVLSGIVLDSLNFAMEFAVKNTILEHAEILIIEIPGKAKCNSCNAIFDLSDLLTPCPECSTFNPEIIQGKEMRVCSITIE